MELNLYSLWHYSKLQQNTVLQESYLNHVISFSCNEMLLNPSYCLREGSLQMPSIEILAEQRWLPTIWERQVKQAQMKELWVGTEDYMGPLRTVLKK